MIKFVASITTRIGQNYYEECQIQAQDCIDVTIKKINKVIHNSRHMPILCVETLKSQSQCQYNGATNGN